MTESPARPLSDADLSGVFAAADALAIRTQRSHVRTMRVHYALLVAAAVAGASSIRVATGGDVMAVLGAICFGGSLLMRVYMATQDFEVTWLRARGIAETVRADSWRFALGVAPYPDSMTAREARTTFVRAQRDEVHDLGVAGHPAAASSPVTEGMLRLREADLPTRQRTYLQGRVLDQMSWYARKSEQHARQANRWLLAMLLAEAAGLTAGVLKASGMLDIDLLGVFGALASAFGAWNQMRQHRRTATIYRGTASRLAALASHGADGVEPDQWPVFVEDAEAILAEEGGAWRSLRSAEPGRAAEESVG